jgi:hypothetical protein
MTGRIRLLSTGLLAAAIAAALVGGPTTIQAGISSRALD